jgi:hypothetical protein
MEGCFVRRGKIQRQQRCSIVPEDDAAILTWKARIEEIIVVSAGSGRIRMGYLLNRLLLVSELTPRGLEAQTCFTTTAKEGMVEGQSHSENISTEIAWGRTLECRIQAQMIVSIEDL